MSLVAYWQTHAAEILRLTGQHVWLVALSTLAAVGAGVPIGVLAVRRPRVGAVLSGIAGVVQTVPSLALFGFLLPLPFVGGIGARTALVALFLYALLPVIRTTSAGLQSIDPSVLDAADAMGMTAGQRFRQVELPLALPSILAGIRVATVVGVGTVTIAAAIGAGGLGEYIYRGLAMVDATVILAGALPAAGLALVADGALLVLQRAARRRDRPTRAPAVLGVSVLLVLAAVGLAGLPGGARIVVGSKNFTEQVILGELTAQAIERYTDLTVERRLNLGGTFICDQALQAGDIDVYVEYSGTALTALFDRPVVRSRETALSQVRQLYADSGRTMLEPFGFNNTFAILVRQRDARALDLQTLTDLARQAPAWRAAFGFEFLERQDGFAGLAATYGLRFAVPPAAMDLALVYRALAAGEVDVIAGDATAGLIAALDLVALEDDRRYFPPYDAVPVMHAPTLLRYPQVGAALARLGGRISEGDMQRMNRAVDVDGADPAAVASAFLDALERGV
ncbi:MAG: ABC transporter permease/substrate-binding protein [Vicinamibacterales bacterium]